MMGDTFLSLFGTEGFPPRWECGTGWTDLLGWTHIISDVATWGAYTAIAGILVFFVLRRKDMPFRRVFWLFAAFMLFCGAVHLIDAIIFYVPIYRVSGIAKFATAVVSWIAVIALIRVLPQAIRLPGLARVNAELEAEIAERKRADDALRESEAKERARVAELEAVMAAVPVVVWIAHDSECKKITGNAAADGFLRIDRNANASLTAPSDERPTGFVVYDASGKLLSPEELPVQVAARTGTTVRNWEETVEFADGERRHLFGNVTPLFDDATGTPRGAVGAFVDITERTRAEAALRESEERFRVALKNSGISVYMFDRDLRFTWVYNPFRFQPSELYGKRPDELLDIPEVPEIMAFLNRVMDSGIAGRRELRVRIDADAPERFFDITAEPLRNSQGDVIGVTVAANNITETKRTELELRTLNDTLEARVSERTHEAEERALQLRAMASELIQAEQRERRRLAVTIHDHLQQLLVAAKLQINGLQTRLSDTEMAATTERVNELLEQSIDASRSLTMELTVPILYEAGLAAALEWLGRWMKDKHGLDVTVRADARANPSTDDTAVFLFQAVRELLFNVVKHAGTRSATVTMERDSQGWLRIEVGDNGVGLNPETLFRSQRAATGFGLFNIRERLELLGGFLEVESVPGAGARFILLVERHTAGDSSSSESATSVSDLSPRSAAAVRIPPHRRGKIRVVLVDDHKIVREGLASLLADEADIELVGEGANGVMAVELARDLRPDVIVMDVNMPRMNGIEATRIIKHEFPDVHIVGLSVHEDRGIADSLKLAGAEDYLTKGGPAEQLCRAIRRVYAIGQTTHTNGSTPDDAHGDDSDDDTNGDAPS